MSGIFISYRRQDSAPYAGRLSDRLCERFGADKLFMDVDDIPPGADFSAHIAATIGSCEAMVVVIGNEWLNARGTDGQLRMADPHDLVALEVSLALQRGDIVIPVLVGGANMPKASELRGDLKALAQRNALILSDREFQRDVDLLIRALESIPGLAAKENKAETRQWPRRRLVWTVPPFMLLAVFAVWWQWSSSLENPQSSGVTAKTADAIAGTWSGDVTYSWGAKYTEQFSFRPEGNSLFGTAMFLQFERGIENGKIVGDTISFQARFEEINDGKARTRWNSYEGKLTGAKIRLRILGDNGDPPADIELTKQTNP